MNYTQIDECDQINGPGKRVSLYVSGCTSQCKGCAHIKSWNFYNGQYFNDKTITQILALLKPDHISGLTLLGGEPLHPRNLSWILRLLRKTDYFYPDKTVWCYTGYLYEDLVAGKIGYPGPCRSLLDFVDVLVDGPYIQSQSNPHRRYGGSDNQRLIDVPASLAQGSVVLWQDGPEERK